MKATVIKRIVSSKAPNSCATCPQRPQVTTHLQEIISHLFLSNSLTIRHLVAIASNSLQFERNALNPPKTESVSRKGLCKQAQGSKCRTSKVLASHSRCADVFEWVVRVIWSTKLHNVMTTISYTVLQPTGTVHSVSCHYSSPSSLRRVVADINSANVTRHRNGKSPSWSLS